jgi:hypothetical protein
VFPVGARRCPSPDRRLSKRHRPRADFKTQSETTNRRHHRLRIMNNGTAEIPASRLPHASDSADELTKLKKELLQAEVRLAKARATVAGGEVDIKVLNARLRALAR